MANDRDSAVQGQEVILQVQFYDADGDEADADEMPTIEIADPNGAIIVSETSRGVSRVDTGLYKYTYTVESDAEEDQWSDTWSGIFDNAPFSVSFTFTVVDPDDVLTADTGPGEIILGDDVVFDFTQEELETINYLLFLLKSRLRSTGVKPSRDEFGAFITDGYGELITEECNVFDDEILVAFLCMALSEFNMIPFFTAYTFADQIIRTLFSAAIVEGAYIFALSAQSIIEKGRDFTISDGGINYQPPQLGDYLQTHYNTWLTSYRERLKFMKNSIRPGPRGYGTYTNLTSGAPAFTRLRHLRARRVL
nr:hypothetical protein 80 [bacterium]